MKELEIKHIYWFAYYNLNSPSVRYRAKYSLDFAREKLGIESHLVIPGYSLKRIFNFIGGYFSALLFLKENSIIVVQRVQSNFIYSNLLKLLVKVRRSQSIYDLDDADYLIHNPKTIHYFARNCKFVSAGSLEILRYLKQYNKNVVHITSPTPDLEILKQTRNKTFTIGWIGAFGWGHKDSLYKYILSAIKNLPFNCRFVLIGVFKKSDEVELYNYFSSSDHVELEIPSDINWLDEAEIQNKIKQFDVGVATLLNHPIQIAKSGIKAKQYMNNGVPVISNDLPENNKLVISGYNGFICNAEEDIMRKLIQIKEMSDNEYWILSRNARHSTVNFNHNKYFKDFTLLTNRRIPVSQFL